MAPLTSRVILDCSTLFPGALIGKWLAERGARVIKIENPRFPDLTRKAGLKAGSYYEDYNAMKEHVSLDLSSPEERPRFHELVAQADALIEGFRPAAKIRLGLDEKTLHGVNRRLCIVSLVGYPEDGPWRDRAGHDLNFQALSGMLSLFGEQPGLPLGEILGAYEGAFSLMCALDEATRTGRGTRVVMSFFETMKRIQSRLVRDFQHSGETPRPGGTLFSGMYPCYHVYRAKDGRRIAVGALEHKFWVKVCEVVGTPDLINDGLATGIAADRAIERIQQAFELRTWDEWAPLFEAADCCVEPVLNYGEVF